MNVLCRFGQFKRKINQYTFTYCWGRPWGQQSLAPPCLVSRFLLICVCGLQPQYQGLYRRHKRREILLWNGRCKYHESWLRFLFPAIYHVLLVCKSHREFFFSTISPLNLLINQSIIWLSANWKQKIKVHIIRVPGITNSVNKMKKGDVLIKIGIDIRLIAICSVRLTDHSY